MSYSESDRFRAVRERLDSVFLGLDRLRNRDGVSGEYLDLQKKLIASRTKAIFRIANTRRIAASLSKEITPEGLERPDYLPPVVEAAALTLEEFGIAAERGDFPEKISGALVVVKATIAADRQLVRRLVIVLLKPSPQNVSRLAGELSVEADVLQFLGRELLKPYFHMLAAIHFTTETAEKWNQARCPICSGFPHIARLDKEAGARWLRCDLCDVEWRFERLTCPFCGNAEPANARYFTVCDDDAMRVSVCDKCQSYIKTYDERKSITQADLLVEDVGSLALDMIAHREGFVHTNMGMRFD